MYTYFTANKNSQTIPLAYFLLETLAPSSILIYREQDIIKKIPLNVNMFSHDKVKVLVILKELTVDNDDDIWNKGIWFGLESMFVLHIRYDIKL